MIKLTRLGLSAAAATVALGLFVVSAQAQTPPAATAPAKTAPPAKAAPAPPTKTAIVCKGMAEAACGAVAECQWIAATKTKPYCKSRPKTKGSAAGSGAGSAAAAPAPAKGSAAPPPAAPAKK